MNEKVVLIGAGSAMFTRGLLADMIRQNWEGELALVDIDSEALETAKKLSDKIVKGKGSPLKITATTNRRNALKDATVVICTIAVGGRRAWETDVFIPRKYGIYQPVGDSVMPGGTSRALRMIPAMVAIAKDVMELSPKALFFNYANPMSCICRAVRKATGAEVTGLCHGVFHVASMIAKILDVDPEKLNYTACGINHLAWFTELWTGGKDLMKELRKKAEEELKKSGIRKSRNGSEEKYGGLAANTIPFTWEMVELFNAFPAVLDRHITEFFPHMMSAEKGYYGKTLGVDAFSFEDTIRLGDNIFEEMKKDAASPSPLSHEYLNKMGGEHEQCTGIIESIRHDRKSVFSVNLPNWGQIPNLPHDAVVECPAITTRDGLRPLMLKPLSSGIVGTLATRFMWVETTVEAALEGSRDKFIQALLLDGSVKTIDTASKMADEFLEVHSEYLPQFKK